MTLNPSQNVLDPERRTFSGVVAMFAAMIALAACGEPGSGMTGSGDESLSYRGTWQLVSGRGPDGEVPVIEDYRITLTMDGGSLTGTAACNRYGGEVATDGGIFRFEAGAMTAMGCRSDVLESEDMYMAALGAADRIARVEDTLILSGNATKLRFDLSPPIPIAEVTDIRWHLVSLVTETDDRVESRAAPAELTIDSDGTLMGSTGCRDLHGEWIEDGDEILFAKFGADGTCLAELQEQDGHVVGVLGDGFTVLITGDQMELSSPGGFGLVYRAAG